MAHPQDIRISDYQYVLPRERIAQYPLERRDQSKLLIYRDKEIASDIFRNLPVYLHPGSHLIFNETRVIPARVILRTLTGARIEIFCLEPQGHGQDYHSVFTQGPGCLWKCMIGNSRRWKSDIIIGSVNNQGAEISLQVAKVSQNNSHFILRFDWTPSSLTFSDILDIFGKTPLPPYIHREADEEDRIRYQTVYAREDGSVAAPTAGLHFTDEILGELRQKGINTSAINLHVSAGTFKPVTSEQIRGHIMQSEYIHITLDFIRKLAQESQEEKILVGTTTVRALESLYWQGAKWLESPPSAFGLDIGQWDPYELKSSPQPSVKESLETIIHYTEKFNQDSIAGYTSLLIAPGYNYKIPDAIITNFHMPRSTAYHYALDSDFRFLSYGDACLLFK